MKVTIGWYTFWPDRNLLFTINIVYSYALLILYILEDTNDTTTFISTLYLLLYELPVVSNSSLYLVPMEFDWHKSYAKRGIPASCPLQKIPGKPLFLGWWGGLSES